MYVYSKVFDMKVYIYIYIYERIRYNTLYILTGQIRSSAFVFLIILFYFIDEATVHNFPGDNSLSAFTTNIKNLKSILEPESKTIISCFQSKNMAGNPGKLQTIIIDKMKENRTK